MMNIAVIGTGYVGLVTSAIFADFGNKVWGVDVDKKKIKSLQAKVIPFYEPGLKEMVSRNIDNSRLTFTTSYEKAISKAKVIFICVGTPPKKDGSYDLKYVFSSAESISENLKRYAVVCLKSTVPPSVNSEVKKIMLKGTKTPFDLASCPEFLREGSAIKDSLNPARVVIGVETEKAKKILLKLHQPIKAPRLICGLKSAQMIKYGANSLLATKISFINSMARLCEIIGANIDDVAKGLGLDPRIGGRFLKAGLGYGGSCFPKDTWALISYAQKLGYDFKFLKEVDNVNQSQIDYFAAKIEKACAGKLKNKTLTILGLSFKPETDDMREARSVKLIQKLQKKGAKINACDPVAIENARHILTGVNFYQDPYQALKQSSALILVTEWEQFRKLDFKKAAQLMKEKIVVDGRNIYQAEKLKKLGFKYQGIGRR